MPIFFAIGVLMGMMSASAAFLGLPSIEAFYLLDEIVLTSAVSKQSAVLDSKARTDLNIHP